MKASNLISKTPEEKLKGRNKKKTAQATLRKAHIRVRLPIPTNGHFHET